MTPATRCTRAPRRAPPGFTRSVATEIGRHGITANNISLAHHEPMPPGARPQLTEEQQAQMEAVMKQACKNYVVRRRGEPEDVAGMVTYLVSPLASWVTGQTIPGERRLHLGALGGVSAARRSPRSAAAERPGRRRAELATRPVRLVTMETVDDVRDALAAHDYLADEGLATAIFLAMRLQRPLLLEGEAGVGKTEVAKVLARWTGGELVRLQCYEGIDAGPGRLRVGLLPPAAAPPGGRGRRGSRSSRTSSTRSASS